MNRRMINCNHIMETIYEYDQCGEETYCHEECQCCGATAEIIKIIKLKLERLMWKAIARSLALEDADRERSDKWGKLCFRCKEAIEKL